MAPEYTSSRRPLASLLIIIGLVILTGSLIVGYLLRSRNESSANNLPRRIAGFTLNTATYGTDAVAEIARMHGKQFPTTYGAMGMYGTENQLTLWIEGFQDKSTATQIIETMANKIALGNSPFTPTGQNQIGNREVYKLDGMGQKHFYFQSGDLVIWLAADPSAANQAIQQMLEEYP